LNLEHADSRYHFFCGMVVLAIFIRLFTLGAYPLTDNTEARYAEVAREMVVSGNWIVPQLNGQKFWSKPPLSIWVAAAAMCLMGKNEFAVRLPSFAFSLATMALMFGWLGKQRDRTEALVSCGVLATTVLFFLSSGAVMTDASLTFATTLSMVSFWRAVRGDSKTSHRWGWLFFVGLSLGLLAKGPVAIVLIGLPVGLWTVWQKNGKRVWENIPWLNGLVLTAVLSLPWYLAVEHQTPGFLKYFIIGEHFKRFMDPGWTGDMYGSAHAQHRGMIWIFWLLAAFPWSILLAGAWWRNRSMWKTSLSLRQADGFSRYLVLWAAAPMIFFTFAGNILWTYVLPGLPAFSILMAMGLIRAGAFSDKANRVAWLTALSGAIVPVLFLAGVAIWSLVPYKHSQKILAFRFQALRPNASCRLVYLYDRPYSAEFYAGAAAVLMTDPRALGPYLKDHTQDFFAFKKRHIEDIPAGCREQLTLLGIFDGYMLFRKK
jgi:4-amino-4-deoxy-L-arabinose transferase-like glycosyltransferase